MKNKHNTYTNQHVGRGYFYRSDNYTAYKDEIDHTLTIFDAGYNLGEIEDIEETLEKSLENRKTFYENAKPYMKKKMRLYSRNAKVWNY